MRTTKTYNKWSKEEEDKLKSLISTTSFERMTKHFPNRTGTSLLKKSIKLGYSSKYKYHKYTVNKNYWNNIDLIKCYYAGFIAADGNLSIKDHIFSIQLNTKDISILENFKKETNFTGSVEIYKRTKFKSGELKEVCNLRISCGIIQWYQDLFKYFNITPRKTFTLLPPNINDIYLKYAYLIGLIDGDGWICPKGIYRSAIGYVGASEILIEWVSEMFTSITGNKYKINQSKSKSYYSIVVDNKDSLIIIDYLRQFPISRLKRKWDRIEILNKIKEYKLERPDLFQTLDLDKISYLSPSQS